MKKFELFDHQKIAIQYADEHPYCILALECGLGKTAVALSFIIKNKLKSYVVVPPYLKLTWKKEIEKFFPGTSVEIFEKGSDIVYPTSQIVIVSYSFMGQIKPWGDAIVFDEVHYLKTFSSLRTESAHEFVRNHNPQACIGLTGTPIKNRVAEYYSLLSLSSYNPEGTSGLCIQDDFPTDVEFADKFSYRREFTVEWRTIVKWEGHRNIDLLKSYLAGKYLRMTAGDWLDLPDEVFKDVIFSDKDVPELWKEFVEERKTNSNMKAKSALMKSEFTAEYVKGLLEDVENVIVYSDHVEAITKIAEKLNIPFITGSTPNKTRDAIAEEFLAGRLKVIAATIGSFSTGRTFTNCSNMVFNDRSYVPGDNKQARARIRRIGQTEICNIHNVFGSYQDGQIWKSLRSKEETIGAVT